jgi:hypothetical protein
MSNGAKTAFALALGAGGGALLWYLLHDDERPPVQDHGKVDVPAGGTCSLRLDKTGLTAEGDKVDVAAAVARCKAAGAARLALTADAPASIYVELNQALARANVPVTVWGA